MDHTLNGALPVMWVYFSTKKRAAHRTVHLLKVTVSFFPIVIFFAGLVTLFFFAAFRELGLVLGSDHLMIPHQLVPHLPAHSPSLSVTSHYLW